MGSKMGPSSPNYMYYVIAAVACVIQAAMYIPTMLYPPPEKQSMLFFDGVCNLCDGFVNLVADNDSDQRVIFGAIQKHKELLHSLGAGKYAEGGSEALTTMILIQGDQVHVRSTAALRTLALLDQPWR